MQRRNKLAIILLLVISVSCLILYWSLPQTQLEVSGFPSSENYASYTAFGPLYENTSYAIINNTYQVHNVGNVNASNVIVKFEAFPEDSSKRCEVISTSVYSGTPSPANLLATAKDQCTISTLNVGEKLVFVFQVKSTNLSSNTKYVLTVNSANAGAFYREVLSQGKYGTTTYEQRWPWW